MKRSGSYVALLLWIFIGSSVTWGEEPPSFEQLLNELLPGMGAEDIPARREPQQRFQEVCFQLGAPGREADRAEACRLMAEKLGPGTAKPARIWLLKQLEFIGRGECVDAVAAVLEDDDPEIRDWARRALENNPAPEANAELLARLQSTQQSGYRVALINSLGSRRDPASADPLGKLLDGRDEAVIAAAANALGKIGGPESAELLARARNRQSGELRRQMADALLRCADWFLKEGDAAPAAHIYRTLDSPDEARPIRLAAMQGQLNTAGDKAASMVLEFLASDDADTRAVAAGHVVNVTGDAAMKTFADRIRKLPAQGQALLLGALAARGDKSAMPVAVAATKSDEEAVRLAGFRALATLGDAAVVPMLIEAMFAGGEAAGPAGDSLQRVYGEGVDEAILAAMKREQDLGRRGTLIDVLNTRKAVISVPALIEEAQSDDAGIRDRAVRALGSMAEPKHVGAMVKLLLKSEKGRRRDELEKAVMFVCGRIGDEQRRADPVLATLSTASPSDRMILLPLLGRIGGPKALQAVESDLKSSNSDLQEAAVRALCNWPDASVADRLLKIAQSSGDEGHRISALRAYVRVITLPSGRPGRKTLAMLKKAMEMATRDDERRLILSRASSVRELETLRWVVPYLENESLRRQACRAVVELAHHRGLMDPNREEFVAALKKVVKLCKDQGLVERAQGYIERE